MGTTVRALDFLAGLEEAVCATDSSGTVIFWNDAAERLYGTPSAKAIGVPIEDIFTVSRGEEPFDSTWRELLARGRFHSDIVQLTQSGEQLPVRSTIRPLQLHNGDSAGLLVVAASEDVARASSGNPPIAVAHPPEVRSFRLGEQRFARLADAAFEGMTITVLGIVLDTNRQLADMLGYDRYEMIGMSILETVAPEDRHRVIEAIRLGGEDVCQYQALRKDGRRFPVEVRGRSFSHEGEHLRLTAVRAIPGKRSEGAVLEGQEMLRAILDTSLDAIGVTRDEICVLCNRRLIALLGYENERAVLGKSIFELFAPGARAELCQCWEAQGRAGEPIDSCIARGLRQDGSELILEVLGSKLILGGEPHRVVVMRDTTASQRRERALTDQLRQAQKLESIGRLAGGVAHDFNNILTTIGANAELAFMELGAADSGTGDALQECLREIRKAVGTASSLTRQLLAFSRKQVIELTRCDLNDVIARMYAILVRVIGEDIELKTVIAQELYPVRADRSQIEQIVLNLVVNARDAMPKGGRLIIQTGNVDLSAQDCQRHVEATPGGYAVLTVNDTGCGIAPEVMAHVFEPFFTTKDRDKGTGLGLATVYGAVKQHGGFIELLSEVGQGTTFKIHFPKTEATATAASEMRPTTPPVFGRGIVVLVEDDSLVRKVAVTLLQRLGYEVISYESGAIAIEAIRNSVGRIDLLITDVIMPGLGGLELAKQVSDLRPGTKVLFTSGYAGTGASDSDVGQVGHEFLPKPYTLAGLSQKVQAMLAAPPADSPGDVRHR